jgi:hypothetical protein
VVNRLVLGTNAAMRKGSNPLPFIFFPPCPSPSARKRAALADTVARSSTHAELRAAASACDELVALRKLFLSLRVDVFQGAVELPFGAGGGGSGAARNPGSNTRALLHRTFGEVVAGSERTPPLALLLAALSQQQQQ